MSNGHNLSVGRLVPRMISVLPRHTAVRVSEGYGAASDGVVCQSNECAVEIAVGENVGGDDDRRVCGAGGESTRGDGLDARAIRKTD
jgi:hypothetical protein